MIPPLFISILLYQPHRVQSYSSTLTGVTGDAYLKLFNTLLQDEFNKNLYFPFHLPGNLYAKDQRLLFLFTVFISNVITLYTNCYHLSTICFKYNKNISLEMLSSLGAGDGNRTHVVSLEG